MMTTPLLEVTVTPNPVYGRGAAQHVLARLSNQLVVVTPEGKLQTSMNADQLAALRLQAPMHRIEVKEPEPAKDPVDAWREISGCATPEEFRSRIDQRNRDIQAAIGQEVRGAVLLERTCWKLVTGCETAAEFSKRGAKVAPAAEGAESGGGAD